MISEIKRQMLGGDKPGCVVASVGGGGLLAGESLLKYCRLGFFGQSSWVGYDTRMIANRLD